MFVIIIESRVMPLVVWLVVHLGHMTYLVMTLSISSLCQLLKKYTNYSLVLSPSSRSSSWGVISEVRLNKTDFIIDIITGVTEKKQSR